MDPVHKGLTRERLAAAALALVDRDGLAKLSMRRLAAELGVDPMAAYRHVGSKDELLDAVVDAVLAGVDLTDLPGSPTDQLREGARRVLRRFSEHPNAAPLLSARQWFTPHGLRVIEWGMATLTAAGWHPADAVVAMNAVGLLLTGLAQAVAGDGTPGAPPAMEAFPVTARALADGHGLRSYDKVLDFTLDALLGGGRTDS